MQMLDDEEKGKGRVQALMEEPCIERGEEQCPSRKEERRNRQRPVCWGCGKECHVLRNCELWQTFRLERHRGCPSKTEERQAERPELN